MLSNSLIFLYSYCKNLFTPFFFPDVWDVIPPTGQTPACATLRMLQWVLQTNTINTNHITTDYTYMVTLVYPIASVGVCFPFQAGGLCFPPNSLSTNVNPSVNYNQLVSLLFHAFNFISLNWYFSHSDFPPCCVSLAEIQHPVCLVRQKSVFLSSSVSCNSHFISIVAQLATIKSAFDIFTILYKINLGKVCQLHKLFVWLQLFSNLTACQALGNMCVMNMHSFSSMSVDACGLFNTIFRAKAALSSTQDISYW